ncbi:Oxygen-independent coproporphyrinogen-III oxidase 1 [Sedimentisphaera cyanobacteriorum]|uniref:Heme chaperone HemW n=1 Tax=Sedimentisphaera cyanobacteriorum TaxID=1940790 RepID=A0A1Q2HMS0_9BACT|nr:radical SAM family heme chaperone HemW [Sedimentisphaera cyanobacteriorum]AQQ08533.1 Oxygen-independent coproporphyrinogen-III oxidase 1 [Sedimentisphaera cyanobacteriorum]
MLDLKSLYVHIPFCDYKCGCCGFYSIPETAESLHRDYLSALQNELKSFDIDEDSLETIYIGGGSPSILSEENLEHLLGIFTEKFSPIEFTIEMNPRQLTRDKLITAELFGVNRLSIGVQSFSEKSLEVLGRKGSRREILNALDAACDSPIENLNIDLIFGLPNQTLEDLEKDLDIALSFEPGHISAYSLVVEQNTPLGKSVESGRLKLPGQQLDRKMYEHLICRLEEEGLYQYEISNFALPDFECLHNWNCWRSEQYIGLGASAGSFYNGRRFTNPADVRGYIAAERNPKRESAALTEKDYAWQTAVLMLRTNRGVCAAEFSDKTGFDFEVLFSAEIEKNINAGLLEKTVSGCRLTPEGFSVADSVSREFVLD